MSISMADYEACCWGFSPGTPVSTPPSLVNGSANKTKVKINQLCQPLSLIVELSLRTTWHVVGDQLSMCCT